MSRVAFLLSKDPTTAHGGDVTMTRLLMQLVAEDHDVVAVCLSEDPDLPAEPGLVRVRKEPARAVPTALAALRTRRSLVHARFDSDALRDAIERLGADGGGDRGVDRGVDLWVAEHAYMAESFLRSSLAGSTPLLVNTHVSESLVWEQTRPRLLAAESRRIRRDELRVARAARAVATFDRDEAEEYRAAGVANACWLALTEPPRRPVDVAASAPRLVFLGDRTWRPNAVAADLARQWWPEIATGIPGAELVVVGRAARDERRPTVPGVTELGFVDDLEALLDDCRALVAPVRTGGGVRVKILEAASRGLPVVTTRAGAGSLVEPFGLVPAEDRAAFVARCRALLADPALAAAEGTRLHRANADHWSARRPQASVGSWLAS